MARDWVRFFVFLFFGAGGGFGFVFSFSVCGGRRLTAGQGEDVGLEADAARQEARATSGLRDCRETVVIKADIRWPGWPLGVRPEPR